MRHRLLQLLPRLSGLASASSSGARVAPVACQLLHARSFADEASLLKTPLYNFHVEHGGKMVPFAGWSMPIQYKDSLVEATLHCRSNASLFDVSHMCGLTLKGKDAIKFLEGLVVGDISGIPDGQGSLSVFTNEQGGIIDDTVITKVSPTEVYLVVNAGCREKDLAHIGKHLDKFTAMDGDVAMEVHDDRSLLALQDPAAFETLGPLTDLEDLAEGGDVAMEVHDDRSLLALQGPAAVETLGPLTDLDLSSFYFSHFAKPEIGGIPCYLTRTGYTGEDGFEISVPAERTLELAKKLMESPRVRLCGLGARDSLRLEAGLCLYGNDLNESITPVEAGLTWTIGKKRREKCDFLGGEVVKKQLADGVSTRRVGLVSTGAPARAHSDITTPDGEKVGEVTSGAFSPCLKKNVAMGYVKKTHGKAGTALKVVVRGRTNDATVTKMPFVPNTYFKAPTTAT